MPYFNTSTIRCCPLNNLRGSKVPSHPQVWVKVNTCVDERMAKIVELLNTVPHPQTVDSCQGDPGEAYLYFHLDGWRDVGSFMFEIIEPALRSVGEYSASVEVFNGSDAMGKITFRAEDSDRVFSALKEVLARHQTFQCSYDTERRELRS